ncbi:hypothetical protein IMCC3135_23060 [Granulosicoccus antarcticus IMCC3135]|uniref:Chromosome partition protein Smc n=2 Tax=Granulosicoccus TaxID=437504 RepID=A0A2Z2NXI0_9GAMM|nr:hypothetical protein IMCC3135_23060 [Granulosicoccus antarcticus IMCC3135]
MEWTSLLPYLYFAVLGIFCLIFGYVLGARRSRVVKLRVLRDLNTQSLELLDTKSSLSSLEHYASQQERKDRLLKLTLQKLQQAEARCRQMSDIQDRQHRKNYVEMSRLRLDAVQAHEAAAKAKDIAQRATAHLQRLEQASPKTQTIIAPEPKSYGTGEPVTVSVVDQIHPKSARDNIVPVSNRDSARLTRLSSSNEASAPFS